jgi:hypothetical protein
VGVAVFLAALLVIVFVRCVTPDVYSVNGGPPAAVEPFATLWNDACLYYSGE